MDINENNRDELLMNARVGIIELLKKTMRPEFLNRIDEIILFKPLTRNEVKEIALLQTNKLQDQLKQKILLLL